MFADPAGRCLSYGDDEPQRLGPFTCVADASFLLRALAATLGFSTLLVVDAGNPPPPPQVGSLGMAWGRVFRLPETLMLQVRRTDIFSEYIIPPTIFVYGQYTSAVGPQHCITALEQLKIYSYCCWICMVKRCQL